MSLCLAREEDVGKLCASLTWCPLQRGGLETPQCRAPHTSHLTPHTQGTE